VTQDEPLPQRVYRLLSDGAFHPGTAIASHCGVSRNAIWKAVEDLRSAGIEVQAVPRRGYRLVHLSELLDAVRIVAGLPPDVRHRLRSGMCVWRTASTNLDLMAREAGPAGTFDFLSAECQTHGRGRRARSWLAPPCRAVCLSLSWNVRALPPHPGALSLAVGVCALRALSQLGVQGVELKWPNDLVVHGGKLGGILIELRAEPGGPAYVVIGIGLNVTLGENLKQAIEAGGTSAVDLTSLGLERTDRNLVVAQLISSIVQGMEQFHDSGFSSFAAEWRTADALSGKAVVVSTEGGNVTGHACGIDIDGALCVQTPAGLQRFFSGDVSVRPLP
jgi:BirA family transcriptional regulator, biotin operon repressor / biotin---[acetyl-CoA-carboxylase] ligase